MNKQYKARFLIIIAYHHSWIIPDIMHDCYFVTVFLCLSCLLYSHFRYVWNIHYQAKQFSLNYVSSADVIFLIFLYQRYIYPTDYKRMNEFGTTGEMHGATEETSANGDAPQAIEDAPQAIEATEAAQNEKSSQEKKDD